MDEFMADYDTADIIVAHNAQFDRNMLYSELMRLHLSGNDTAEEKEKKEKAGKHFIKIQNSQKFYCTMCEAKMVVGIDTKLDTKPPEQYDRQTRKPMRKPRIPNITNKKIYPDPNSKRYEMVLVQDIKSPALWETYDKLFGYPPDESQLHDAMIDVIVCLRVFYRLWFGANSANPKAVCGKGTPDIYGKDKKTKDNEVITGTGDITKYIKKITPKNINPRGNFKTGPLQSCFITGDDYQRIPGQTVYPYHKGSRSLSLSLSLSNTPKTRTSTGARKTVKTVKTVKTAKNGIHSI